MAKGSPSAAVRSVPFYRPDIGEEEIGAGPDTLNIDPADVARKITPRTRAIVPVHFAGHPAPMDELLALARDHRLTVLEDAAHALPASYRGTSIGSVGDMTAFSFYATKNLTTG